MLAVVRRSAWVAIALAALAAACSSGSSADPESASTTCTPKEPGTRYASCEEDSDCYSGICNQDCKGGPCCATRVRGTTGRGYSCKTDEDCIEVAPDFAQRGGKVGCERSDLYDGCYFECPKE